jgi:hypothetical protein
MVIARTRHSRRGRSAYNAGDISLRGQEEKIIMVKTRRFVAITVLVLASFACSALTRVGGSGDNSSAGSGYDTKFPLPSSVVNFTDTGKGSINFQTKMSLKDTVQFYREALQKQGLKERPENTAITDQTFSLVFDGDPSGQAVVVQGVDLGNGLTNVNIRYEKL